MCNPVDFKWSKYRETKQKNDVLMPPKNCTLLSIKSHFKSSIIVLLHDIVSPGRNTRQKRVRILRIYLMPVTKATFEGSKMSHKNYPVKLHNFSLYTRNLFLVEI